MDISKIPKRIKAIYELNGREAVLPDGASEKSINDFEAYFNLPLSDDFKLLYKTLDGRGNCYLGNFFGGDFEGCEISLYSLSEIKCNLELFPFDYPYFYDLNKNIWDKAPGVDPFTLGDGSKLIFAYGGNYDFFIDNNPSDKGVIGQIIAFDMDRVRVLSPSLNSFLNSALVGFEKENEFIKPIDFPKNPFSNRVVFKFLKEDNVVIFKRYVEEGLDIKVPDYEDYNVHYWAVKNKSKNILSYIYDKKLLPLYNVFINAVALESKEIMQHCIDSGLGVNFLPKGGGTTLLGRILQLDSDFVMKAIDYLLENGAEINKIDSNGETPLDYGYYLLDMNDVSFNKNRIQILVDYIESKGGKFSFKL